MSIVKHWLTAKFHIVAASRQVFNSKTLKMAFSCSMTPILWLERKQRLSTQTKCSSQLRLMHDEIINPAIKAIKSTDWQEVSTQADVLQYKQAKHIKCDKHLLHYGYITHTALLKNSETLIESHQNANSLFSFNCYPTLVHFIRIFSTANDTALCQVQITMLFSMSYTTDDACCTCQHWKSYQPFFQSTSHSTKDW